MFFAKKSTFPEIFFLQKTIFPEILTAGMQENPCNDCGVR